MSKKSIHKELFDLLALDLLEEIGEFASHFKDEVLICALEEYNLHNILVVRLLDSLKNEDYDLTRIFIEKHFNSLKKIIPHILLIVLVYFLVVSKMFIFSKHYIYELLLNKSNLENFLNIDLDDFIANLMYEEGYTDNEFLEENNYKYYLTHNISARGVLSDDIFLLYQIYSVILGDISLPLNEKYDLLCLIYLNDEIREKIERKYHISLINYNFVDLKHSFLSKVRCFRNISNPAQEAFSEIFAKCIVMLGSNKEISTVDYLVPFFDLVLQMSAYLATEMKVPFTTKKVLSNEGQYLVELFNILVLVGEFKNYIKNDLAFCEGD